MMFQTVTPQEIFDPRSWQVSEAHPAYWLAQLRKKEWIRLLLLFSMKPAERVSKSILAGRVLEKLKFRVCDTRLDAYKTWQAHPGSIVIQFRHSHADWSRVIPEILPPEMGGHLGFVNVAGRLVRMVRKNE